MAKVTLGSALRRWISDGSDLERLEFPATTLEQLLQALFAHSPSLRGYVLDEHGRARHHVALFVDGEVVDKQQLSRPLAANAEVYIMQALSGG
ncbi:MAG: MoaD/ThiS family protein [Xanthomonadales bacterium]|nr:MoaD/ThiS family protein [Xanthomonadales bacterium]